MSYIWHKEQIIKKWGYNLGTDYDVLAMVNYEEEIVFFPDIEEITNA